MRGLSAIVALALAACGSATAEQPEQLQEPGSEDSSVDGALSFDGLDDYASVGTARFPTNLSDQTSMLWFRAEPGADELQVLFTLKRGNESGYALALDADVPLVFKVFGNRELARASAAATLESWHHFAYVITSQASELYLDGVLVGGSEVALTNRTAIQAFVGSVDGSRQFYRGALDELRVYERAFSASELAAVAAGQPPDDTELAVLYLPFNEAQGARAYDRSGLGNHAQLGDGVPELMPARIPR